MDATVHFLLNGLHSVAVDAPGDLTVLDWLRVERRLTGSKEGCAEGDCGACTVVVGEAVGGHLQLKAVNACIAMVSMLHGKLLLTVEALANGTALHPVQHAMVDHHASQCGFCTPGFVMSLFARFHQPGAADEAALHQTFSGNLCRCTGYRPIVDAARAALAGPRDDQFSRDEKALVAALEAIGPRALSPTNLPELAAAIAAYPQARLIAGTTDAGLDVTKHGKPMPLTISLGAVRELRGVTRDAAGWHIGAAEPLIALDEVFASYGADALTLLERVGSVQIRNAGTMGGNCANASPIGDTPPLLLAIGAEFELFGPAGTRRVRAEDFFIGYRKTALQSGEVIARMHLPPLGPGETLKADKISRRFDQDISAVVAVMWLKTQGGRIADCRIAFGGMADRTKLAAHTMARLKGQPLTLASFEAAAQEIGEDFTPIDDARASARYRLAVAGNLLTRWGMALCAEAVA